MNLLVADDVKINRNVIERFLSSDFNVFQAEDGVEALKILQRENIDVVILDIMMPNMNGLDLLTEMRKREEWKHIGVLVATSVKEETERKALSAGADDVVAKPYDPIVIKQRIKNIMATKTLDRQQEEDRQGITREERRFVDRTLFSLRDNVNAISENIENTELVKMVNQRCKDDLDALITLLTTKED